MAGLCWEKLGIACADVPQVACDREHWEYLMRLLQFRPERKYWAQNCMYTRVSLIGSKKFFLQIVNGSPPSFVPMYEKKIIVNFDVNRNKFRGRYREFNFGGFCYMSLMHFSPI